MLRADDRNALWSALRAWRQEGLTVALVPTMGNLHAGHLALVEAARKEADRVVTSIFVNPAQFGPAEDFGSYPRTLEADGVALERAGCDLLFVPDLDTMYPYGLDRAVRLKASEDLAGVLEGDLRPGHFDGVVTVVARLFNRVAPDVAVFGEKDYQQLLIIQRMTADLGYDIRIVPVPTVREQSGLAMSSRNNYLAQAERKSAGLLHEELLQAAGRLESGSDRYRQVEQGSTHRLEKAGFKVDYFAVRRAADLKMPRPGERVLRVLAAVHSVRARLIDNVGVIRVGISVG